MQRTPDPRLLNAIQIATKFMQMLDIEEDDVIATISLVVNTDTGPETVVIGHNDDLRQVVGEAMTKAISDKAGAQPSDVITIQALHNTKTGEVRLNEEEEGK